MADPIPFNETKITETKKSQNFKNNLSDRFRQKGFPRLIGENKFFFFDTMTKIIFEMSFCLSSHNRTIWNGGASE
jgi:hypothetical protein